MGENVFGVLPTSGGKSLTFQTVARMTKGLTVIISPLIALMKDLVARHPDGESLYFNSDLSPSLKKEVKRRIREGKVRLLYISPERLKSSEFKELLNSSKHQVKRIVIDEAHCVVEWGYSFRAKYLHIAQEIEAFEKSLKSKVPVLLLTATASPWLQGQIVDKLRVTIPDGNFITQTEDADRPELILSLRSLKNEQKKIDWIKKQLSRGGPFHKKRGIIFSAYADGGESKGAYNAEKICEELKRLGVKKIGYYHGSMNLDERRGVQKNFQDKSLDILIATKAFGMGIDLPELDFIVHYYPPISLEEYWQEAGRGGRGMEKGQYCQCVVLHAPTDQNLLDNFTISTSFASMLSTFTCATEGVVCFNAKDITKGGNLRKLLTNLHKQKNIRKLKNIQVGRATIERWKLLKSPNAVLKNMDRLFKNKAMKKTEQIRKSVNILTTGENCGF
jgi:ATP-dependent DNA helicase RecQ